MKSWTTRLALALWCRPPLNSRLALLGGEQAVAAQQVGQGDTAQSAARLPEKTSPIDGLRCHGFCSHLSALVTVFLASRAA